MPRLEKSIRRERKKAQQRKMGISGRGLLAPVDWEDRLKKQRRRRRGKE
jgi:hypothetical protein